MRAFVVCMALAVACGTAATAWAQGPVRASERFCLEVLGGYGGPQPLLCRFETLGQCMAARTAQVDRCWLNPALATQRH
jgi:hypothetical protein